MSRLRGKIYEEKGVEPPTLLIRRQEVLRWTGLTQNAFDAAVVAGMVPFKCFTPNSYRFFLKDDIKRIFLSDTSAPTTKTQKVSRP
jgi:hypothetical protein